MKRKVLVLALSITMVLGMALPVHAEGTNGYIMDANGNIFSLTPSEADKEAFGQAMMESATVKNSQTSKTNGGYFDPTYYAANNPDVVAAFGNEPWALYYHYSQYGYKENRLPYKGATTENTEMAKWDLSPAEVSKKMKTREAELAKQASASVQASPAAVVPADGIVAIKDLANYSSLKKKMTDAEFQAAYDEALKIVQPLVGLSKEEQAKGIFNALRTMADNGTVSYSEEAPHYNDAYGYLISHVASCAGSARTTGLCLNMLGMSYEHVNENQWSHQWCRVNIDGVMWIVDPYGYVCAEESAPYEHPAL